MDAVGVEEIARGVVVTLGLDALDLGEQPADAFAERRDVHANVVGLAVALAHVDRRRVRHQPPDDHLPVAHVVLLDLRAVPDPPELHERVPRVRLVLGEDDLLLVLGRQHPDLGDLRLGHEVERDEVRPRLLERRVLLLQRELRLTFEVFGDASRSVTEHFVDAGRDLARDRAPFLGSRDLIFRPAELAPERRRLRLVVGLVDVGERHRLAAVLFADRAGRSGG